MGASFQSYCVRTGELSEVRGLLLQWLEMKGFEAVPEQPLFEGEDVRSLILFWNDRWTTVLYNRHEELERLEFELSKLPQPLLKVWVYDSDLWGYDLSRARELLASFHSNPAYFGEREELPLPENGNPELLCRVCGLPGLERQIADLQRSKRFFTEGLAERFSTLIGATPAALPHDVVTDFTLPARVIEAGDFRMERLFFRESRGDWKTVRPNLHALEVEQMQMPGPAELPPGVAEQVRRWQLFARVIGIVLKPLALVLGLLFGAWFALKRPGRRRSARATEMQRILDDLGRQSSSDTGRAGNVLTNARFQCRITLPAGVEGEAGSGQALFRFRIREQQGWCTASAPETIRNLLRVPPTGILRRDDLFQIDGLPARALEIENDTPYGRSLVLTTIIQAEDAIFSFHLTTRSPAPEGLRQRFEELARTFQRLG